ncbi:HEAT repeat domain-containing protein [Salipaludibacillus agaradhaerens]|uniref:HEAT repeat domain-containing protein n=1 Tax=Salipaludibacillus agaradhaerens TaxID=76935 RepID=A0A9Q4B5E9_SALAG|nr:hypothetical protein [Salipaludibacillus agaradhaerens]MCR6098669.1 HEAT repeat domain-containing protein [Salipaludibacillus agaradhaerens]MCR6115676.1 HEAT repeat domain-containing protein [Salipaludibacillus agaradhaerens]
MVNSTLLIVGVLLIIQLSLLIYLYTEKKSIIKRNDEANSLFQQLFPKYLPFLTGDSDIEPCFPQKSKLKQVVLERILTGFAHVVTDPVGNQRIKEVAECQLLDCYRKTLKTGNWSERLNALYLIEEFMMDALREDIKEHLNSVEMMDEEYRQTLRTLASFEEESLLDYILSHPHMSQRLIKEIMRRLPVNILIDLMRLIKEKGEETPEAVKYAFIDYCGEAGYYELLPFIESMLGDTSKETRIKALKSLYHYQYCTSPELIIPFFTSVHWEERLYAAKLAGEMNLTEFSNYLMLLAGDRVWWVRFQACEAIKQLSDGKILLTYLTERHEDVYAQDMAKQSLTMRVGGHV